MIIIKKRTMIIIQIKIRSIKKIVLEDKILEESIEIRTEERPKD